VRIQLLALGMIASASAGETVVSVQLVQNEIGTGSWYMAFSKFEAARMFSIAGLPIEWCSGPKGCRDWEGRIIVTLKSEGAGRSSHGALAEADWLEGRNIRVFMERIKAVSGGQKDFRMRLLAHVFAHEIAHILQACDRHSDSGLMSGHWSSGDFTTMSNRSLPFDPADIEFMRDGLAWRRREREKNSFSGVTVLSTGER
jgi:hypothetical protein